MNKAEREQLVADAEAKNLRLERRERTAGAWVWDAIDSRTGVVALRGVRFPALAAYIRGGGGGEER